MAARSKPYAITVEKMNIQVASAEIIKNEVRGLIIVTAEHAYIEVRVCGPVAPDTNAVVAAYDIALQHLDPA